MSADEHKGLVPVVEQLLAGVRVQTVDARDLHGALGVRKDFTNWVKQQIARLRLQPDRDYRAEVFALEGVNSGRGRPEARYWLTLDAAKHIAMMANTDRGFQVREYFIECERRAQGATPRIAATLADPAPLAPKPFEEWSLEETRTNLSVAQTYHRLMNKAAGGWMLLRLGFPKPPERLLPAWAGQSEMDVDPRGSRNVVVVTMPNGDGRH